VCLGASVCVSDVVCVATMVSSCLLLHGQNEANMAQIRFDLCPGVDVYGKDKMCSGFPFLKKFYSRFLDYRIITMVIR